MAMEDEEDKSPPNSKNSPRGSASTSGSVGNGGSRDGIFSPRFRSVAAMAGWDEEALLLASFIVDDTPERESKPKKRINLQFKTPPVSSRRKRRVKRQSPDSNSIPIGVLNLDEEETVVKENDKKKIAEKSVVEIEDKENNGKEGNTTVLPEQTPSTTSPSDLPCMDRLKEELSCAICLDICFEPSTTPCGHSFCKQCLKSAADKCGRRCPKCRQLISNGRYCTVNTVLWNTIQLLFPKEVEAKAAARVLTNGEGDHHRMSSPVKEEITNTRSRGIRVPGVGAGSREIGARRSRDVPSQAEDAALALRLQREEFMEAFRGSNEAPRASPISSARANIRAMASRAMNNRLRERFS